LFIKQQTLFIKQQLGSQNSFLKKSKKLINPSFSSMDFFFDEISNNRGPNFAWFEGDMSKLLTQKATKLTVRI